jgi:hypothetical protein
VSFRYVVILLVLVAPARAAGADRKWENPVFHTVEEAVAAARSSIPTLAQGTSAQRLFVDLTLARGDVAGVHPSALMTRDIVGNFAITHRAAFADNDVQRRTIDRFRSEVPRQQRVVERRLARFGYPELPGLVYCRLVDSVDAFSGLATAASDKMTQVGGVTYYCRYVVLPLSYVGEQNLSQLRRSAARNPSVDVDATVRRWQRESFANLINTFRHELVHVHTNSAIGLPGYSDRKAYPTWFHEGTATYLAADPHSGLSEGYREFQDLFFYLVQRHGVGRLREFYTAVLGGSRVTAALADVFAIPDGRQLFVRARRWHRTKDVVKNGLWIAALVIVIAAFRGVDRPHIGALQLLVAAALGGAVATGLAEHLYGLRGAGVVLGAKLVFVLIAVAVGFMGVRRIRRFQQRRG